MTSDDPTTAQQCAAALKRAIDWIRGFWFHGETDDDLRMLERRLEVRWHRIMRQTMEAKRGG